MLKIKSLIMSKMNKMPTTILLLIFSWLIPILGLIFGLYPIITRFDKASSWLNGLLIFLGSLLLAAIIRMLSDVGQMFFDLRVDIQRLFSLLSGNLQILTQRLISLNQDLKTQTTAITQHLQDLKTSTSNDLKTQTAAITQHLQFLKDNLEQLSCDSKDINQNIYQIRTFFEQIERHLDLKK